MSSLLSKVHKCVLGTTEWYVFLKNTCIWLILIFFICPCYIFFFHPEFFFIRFAPVSVRCQIIYFYFSLAYGKNRVQIFRHPSYLVTMA